MEFISPIWMVGCFAVVIAGLWAIFSPARQRAIVPSLSLWEQAVDTINTRSTSRLRKINLPWALFFMGAILSCIALGKPEISAKKNAERVTVFAIASAENCTQSGIGQLRESTRKLLAKFTSDAKVRLIFSSDPPAEPGWLSKKDALAKLENLRAVPVKLRDINWLTVPANAQNIFVISAGQKLIANNQQQIFLTPNLPAVTFRQASIEKLENGQLAVYTDLRNNTGNPISLSISYHALVNVRNRITQKIAQTKQINLKPGQHFEHIQKLPALEAQAVSIRADFRNPAVSSTEKTFATANFVLQKTREIRIALIGKDLPFLRRYINSDQRLTLVARPEAADILLVSGAYVPGKFALKPKLLIATKQAGPGWVTSQTFSNIPGDKIRLADDIITRNLNLDAIAFRKIVSATQGDFPTGKSVAFYENESIISRSTPESLAYDNRRWVYLGFDLSSASTNLPISPQFVVLMMNCIDYLSQSSKRPVVESWRAQSPVFYEAGLERFADNILLKRDAGEQTFDYPGIYITRADPLGCFAVNQFFAKQGAAKSANVATQFDALKLPSPVTTRESFSLVNILVLLALASWITGWFINLKN